VTQLDRYWYAACFGTELRERRPLARTILGVPLVLFRDLAGRPAALVDRCPHRNAPLSLGRCERGQLRCAYHGWRFDAAGECTEVPGLEATGTTLRWVSSARRVDTFPVFERDGIVWVVPSEEPPARPEPPRVPHADEAGYTTVRHRGSFRSTVLAAVENALDVPHTAFLHRGLFRGRREPVAIEAVVRHGDGWVEAEYIGEPVPPGLGARLLAPEGGVVEHVDRFVAPSMSQVEYRLADSHLVVTTAFTAVDEDEVSLHATVAFRSKLPAAMISPFVTPVARWILRQDSRILRAQHDNIQRFGGARFVNTPIDVLGPHISRLIRRAARGEPLTIEGEREQRVTLHV
jgi:phenylpropionate dioxygenase-like ring-hydroxylating dioxygenase large terminal subunit